MLLNISQDYTAKKAIIDAEVGKTFPLTERQKLKGISIKALPITAASLDIYNLLTVNENGNVCAVEMRPKGIIISFGSMKETFALVIPYYKLKIYKGRAREYSFYRDQHFIKIWSGSKEPEIHSFIKKVRKYKYDTAPTRIEDL